MDLGSTTAKIALIDADGRILYEDYRRHKADILGTLTAMLDEMKLRTGNVTAFPTFTGSAGMGLSERTGLPFIQEVVAAAKAVHFQYPAARMLIDIGGEDSKMIFFDADRRPDMRMNGNCAGGTGAFIDQMASLMDMPLDAFSSEAGNSTQSYPIASRCGVFAKTDIQNLINMGIPKPDIAYSVFRAVAVQAVNSLTQGHDMQTPVIFIGGPLHYFQPLRQAFIEVLGITEDDAVLPMESQIFPAYGAALSLSLSSADAAASVQAESPANPKTEYSLKELTQLLHDRGKNREKLSRKDQLFTDKEEFDAWNSRMNRYQVMKKPLVSAEGQDIYLGIDAGSTTTKIAAIDRDGAVLYRYYRKNGGSPVDSVRNGLQELKSELERSRIDTHIAYCMVTGYGEELIKAAFEADEGMVETLAHYAAAKQFDPEVSFILDIGGQDMKAIFIQDGMIRNIDMNEACSSGCGSFIETFADSLGYSAEAFGRLACESSNPVNLGSRCTVFMNSSVKQALRQGNSIADVSAGLSYSVIRNCLEKVLKISDPAQMGDRIVVQGGTFKNPSVLRAIEKLLGTEVVRPDIAEAMGAYGAAITARDHALAAGVSRKQEQEHPIFRNLALAGSIKPRTVTCRGCTNQCRVRIMQFPNGKKYVSGSRCERFFTNSTHAAEPGMNMYRYQYNALMKFPGMRPGAAETASAREAEKELPCIGIPMVLNMFENYPFWSVLFSRLGFRVCRSELKEDDKHKNGSGTIMSDNICYPAKLAHGHILQLIEKKVDRIFFPRAVYEFSQFPDSSNYFNCPVISGYPDVIISAIDPERYGIPIDSPAVNFNDPALLKRICRDYFFQLYEKTADSRLQSRERKKRDEDFNDAFAAAVKAYTDFKQKLLLAGMDAMQKARRDGTPAILLAGRPYHADPMINHSIPDMISKMGYHVLSLEAVPLADVHMDESVEVTDQWEYSNRLYRAAYWAGRHKGIEFVQFNSFGCGPDAITIDEVKEILKRFGSMPALLKIDEITSLGSAKLRVRSLMESRLEFQTGSNSAGHQKTESGPHADAAAAASLQPARPAVRKKVPRYEAADRHRTILAPNFSPFYSIFIESVFRPMGYTVEILPPSDEESISMGLKYANHDICYPATITIGDIIKALKSGKYQPDDIAVGLTETGGQCRATNYVSLLKKALLNAGFDSIPAVSASLKKESMNKQPGFVFSKPKVMSLSLSSLLVVDQLVRMYHATAVRETEKGASLRLLNRYMDVVRSRIGSWSVKKRNSILKQAIADFNAVSVRDGFYPRAGLVGEIYVKYNPFSNGDTINILMDQGIEVTVPPLLTFFLQTLVNTPYNHKQHIKQSGKAFLSTLRIVQQFVDNKIGQVERIMQSFRLPLAPFHTVKELAEKAEKVISLSNQFGEGWLLPAEIMAMAESGIRHVLSLQPFGCIANHVVAKGVSKRLKTLYPDLNLLPLDMDAGNSAANVHNRLAFFIHSVKDSMHEKLEEERRQPLSDRIEKTAGTETA